MNLLEQLLGAALDSPEMERAAMLARNDRRLLRELVAVRKERGLSQQQVAEIMGVTQPTVAAFEAHDGNPTLQSVRRYAHAVGALVRHVVEADHGQLQNPIERAQWVSGGMVHAQVKTVPGAATFRYSASDVSPVERDWFALAA